MTLIANKERVYEAVAQACHQSGRALADVTPIAVTKYVDLSTTQALIATGVSHLGENRVDKFLEKYRVLKDQALTWHFIGSLQRRKVKDVINLVDYFHALDSLSLAKEIQKRADHPIKCFLQVNISGETSKHGFSPEEVDAILSELNQLDKIELVGLMTMAPFDADEETLREIFSRTRQLRDRITKQKLSRFPLTELSMGMSGDFSLAIEQGATYVRIGSAFFD